MSNSPNMVDKKKMGAFLGAAIGDAMGGPVESSHYKRIQKKCGRITDLVEYNDTYMLAKRFEREGGPFYPGYALHSDAGSITDDTFCRKDVCRFYINTQPPRTPKMLADWLIENGELDTQWPAWMVRVLHWIQEGKVKPDSSGDTFKQGGGIGWWSPLGIFYAGDPQGAAAEMRKMSAIWKAPLERDLGAAVVAAVAEGCREEATWQSMVDAMLAQCGPCAKALLERAIRIAESASDTWDLAKRIYDEMLMPETAALLDITPEDPPTDANAPLPPVHEHLEYTDEPYTTYYWSEQIPIALAAFVFGKGDPECLPICINIGRDCDTTGTTIGAWLGALHGVDHLPKDWIEKVCKANAKEMDLMSLAHDICNVKVETNAGLNDRKKGAFIGAAIGDAMGGPVECSHYKRIRRIYPDGVQGLEEYNATTMLASRLTQDGGPFFPGYALHGEPGSVTDDTFCRKDMLNFFLNNTQPYTPEKLASWLIDNGELDTQWPAWMVRALYWIRDGKVTAEECGNTFKQGGGIGWWSPIGMMYAGRPEEAAALVRKLSAIWKAPLERDFAAAVVAGIAVACDGKHTWEDVVSAILSQCGPCAKALLERAANIARDAGDVWDLADKLYSQCLMAETSLELDVCPEDPPTAVDAPLPPVHPMVSDTDEEYTTCYWAEQIPLALAAFIYAKGSVDAIPVCVSIGRDCDTTATTVGAWVGGLHGLSRLPKQWVEQVCKANIQEMDLLDLAEKLCGIENE